MWVFLVSGMTGVAAIAVGFVLPAFSRWIDSRTELNRARAQRIRDYRGEWG